MNCALPDGGSGPSVDQGLVRDHPSVVPLLTHFVGSVALLAAGPQILSAARPPSSSPDISHWPQALIPTSRMLPGPDLGGAG